MQQSERLGHGAIASERQRLFTGVPSRIILANLPTRQLRNLLLSHGTSVGEAGLGETWPEFRDNMRAIRRRGFAVASEIDPLLVGISAPMFYAPGAVTASLCLVRRRSKLRDAETPALAELAVQAARRISAELQRVRPGAADLPRAAFPVSPVR